MVATTGDADSSCRGSSDSQSAGRPSRRRSCAGRLIDQSDTAGVSTCGSFPITQTLRRRGRPARYGSVSSFGPTVTIVNGPALWAAR